MKNHINQIIIYYKYTIVKNQEKFHFQTPNKEENSKIPKSKYIWYTTKLNSKTIK